MACYKWIRSVLIAFNRSLGKRSWVSYSASDTQKIAVNKPSFVDLEHSTKKFQNLPAQQLVIAINNDKDILMFAKLFRSPPQIRHCSLLFFIFYHDVSIWGNFGLISKKMFDLVACSICTGIVDEDNVIVGVLLHDYWLDVFDVKVILDVVVAGNYNAYRQLGVRTHVVLFLVILPLLLR